MKKLLLLIFLCYCHATSFAQLPYTQPQFAYDSTMNQAYGMATDFAGNAVSLRMDIYKPLGDNNCRRPVMVMVHGGAWVAGSKEDPDMVYMTRQLAKRGWVVANINYRLGVHTTANHTMYALCNPSLAYPCAYIADSSETYRALYRAMQDTKGAIRYMKMRYLIDSTDCNNVYVAGQSAGGFNALAAAFTDQISEKHPSCYAIADAPIPDSDMAGYGCIPNSISRSRPDLGSIEGNLHTGMFDAGVQGVGCFFGGVLDTLIFQQVTPTSPAVYLFHQGSDVVVHYDRDWLLGRLSYECLWNICQPYYFTPMAYGGEGVRKHFVNLGTAAPDYVADIVYNYDYQNNCFSNGHSIDYISQRFQTMVDHFADRIASTGNVPGGCMGPSCIVAREEPSPAPLVRLFPNPAHNRIILLTDAPVDPMHFFLVDMLGRNVAEGWMKGPRTEFDVSALQAGVYFIRLATSGRSLKFVKN